MNHQRNRLNVSRPPRLAAWIVRRLSRYEHRFSLAGDLEEAYAAALNAMLDLMGEQHALERKEALALASLVVDLRITQTANGVQGVHAVLPHGSLEMGSPGKGH